MQRGELADEPEPPEPPPEPEPAEPDPGDTDEIREAMHGAREAQQVIDSMIEHGNVSTYAAVARYRDECSARARQLRAALAAVEDPSEEELMAEVEQAAADMPPHHAEIMIDVFRRRNLL